MSFKNYWIFISILFTQSLGFIVLWSSASANIFEEIDKLEKDRRTVNSNQFEELSKKIMPLLPVALEKSLKENNVQAQEQVLFSAMRTRHYFFGMPRMIGELCPGDHSSSFQALVLVDGMTTQALQDADFQDLWQQNLSKKTYEPKIFRKLQENFLIECATPLSEGFLASHKRLLDLAFTVYEVFSPKVTFEQAYGNIVVTPIFRGWTLREGRLCVQGEEGFFTKMQERPYYLIPSHTSQGVLRGETVAVEYLFEYWEKKDVQIHFSLEKDLSTIGDSLRRFLLTEEEAEKGRLLVKEQFTTLRDNFLESSRDKKIRTYEEGLQKGRASVYLLNNLALCLDREGQRPGAIQVSKMAADQGFPPSQNLYAWLLENSTPQENMDERIDLYYQQAIQAKFEKASENYERYLEKKKASS